MKLIFQRQVLGEISEVGSDQPWVIGSFHPAPSAKAFQEFFAWMVDEDNSTLDEPPFDPGWLSKEYWFIEDETGSRRPICVPAIHEDGQIWWRWQ